jgi:hypothetical protein
MMERLRMAVSASVIRVGMTALLLGSSDARAQVTASIAGSVKDATGAVLPGVTVEAASPALIEKVRTGVTDSSGEYKIVDLRPGTYTVTFALTGFSTVKREGLELSSGFTATVNGELRVGSLEETITVTGASPIVDTQNSRSQQVLKGETLDMLPSGSKAAMTLAALTLGATSSVVGLNDVGGDKGDAATGIVMHGGRGEDGRFTLDGMSTNTSFQNGGGAARAYYLNTAAVQEVVVDTGNSGADTETGGANVNMVPREGSNSLRLFGNATYTNERFSAKSIQDYLRDRGTGDQSSVKAIWDHSVAVGGPFKQDRLWFFATSRWWGAQSYAANNYFNKSTNPLQYVPDLTKPAYADLTYVDTSLRLTWQAAEKHKIGFEQHLQNDTLASLALARGAPVSPEATVTFVIGPAVLSQATWSYVATPRLLVQAGANYLHQPFGWSNTATSSGHNINHFTGVGRPNLPGPDVHAITEQTLGYTWGSQVGTAGFFNYAEPAPADNISQRVALSYVTGSHSFKVGLQVTQMLLDVSGLCCGVNMVAYQFRNGAPVAPTQWAGPVLAKQRMNGEGLYAQDQWTLKRLTLNLGVRFDHFKGRMLAVTVPAGPFTQERLVPELNDMPNFKDITPRLGASYDLFGNGKTAVKVAFGKYLMGLGGGLTQSGFAPALAILTNVTRTWADRNNNFAPDCDLKNQTANGECGPGSPFFAQPIATLSLDDSSRRGWSRREYNYQTSFQLQHELRAGLGLTLGYFNTRWGNHSVTQNTLVTPSDFTEYCINAPTDARLGHTSGKQICGIYDVNPGKFGQVRYLVQNAEDLGLGTPKEAFNGVDTAINARWGKGAFLSGGVTVGRQNYDYCYANGHPELTPQNFPVSFASPAKYPRTEEFCRVTSSWWKGIGSQAKAQFVYPLPYHVTLSGTWKTIPGIPVTANYTVAAAQVAADSTLGRTPTGVSTVTYSLVPFGINTSSPQGTVFDKRLYQTDVRVSKAIRFGSRRIRGDFDIYNLFNSRVPQSINPTYGASWLRPTQLLGGRLFKFGGAVDF